MFVETNPAPIKRVLERSGLIASGFVRPPLIPVTERGRRPIERTAGRRAAGARRTARRARPSNSPDWAPHDRHRHRRQPSAPTVRCPTASATTSAASTSTAPTVRTLAVDDPATPRDVRRARRRRRRRHRPRRPLRRRRPSRRGRPCRHGVRSSLLQRIADAIERRGDEIAAFESFDTGQPITQAHGLAARSAENFRYFAEVCGAIHEDAFRAANQFGYVVRRPKGVAGLITPWNVPFMLATWKLAPCLAAGCTVVLKPAELTPLTASLFPEIVEEAGLPAGVFNIVHGVGEEAGAALVAHPDVPVISFTGETATGKTIMAHGGRSPEGSVDGARRQVTVHRVRRRRPRRRPSTAHCSACSRSTASGAPPARACSSSGRSTTTSSSDMAKRASAIRVGDPADPDTEVGALGLDRALRAGAVVRRRPVSPRAPVSSPAAAAPSTCRPATTWRRPCSPT